MTRISGTVRSHAVRRHRRAPGPVTSTPSVLALALALVLAGCGTQPAEEQPTAAGRPEVAASDLPAPADAPEPPRSVPARCRAGDPIAVGRGPVEAALGSRYLLIRVRSCSREPVSLDRPVVTGVTGTDRTGTLRLTPTPVADRPDRPFTLAPGETVWAGLRWLAEPRTAAVRQLRISATAADEPDVVPLDVPGLRLGTRLDYYPWAARRDAVF